MRRSSRPNPGAPTRCNRASCRPKSSSPSGIERPPPSIHASTSRGGEPSSPSDTASTSGIETTSGARNQRRPRASVVKKPAGGERWVLANTTRASARRSRYASATSPPPSRPADSTSTPRSFATASSNLCTDPSVFTRPWSGGADGGWSGGHDLSVGQGEGEFTVGSEADGPAVVVHVGVMLRAQRDQVDQIGSAAVAPPDDVVDVTPVEARREQPGMLHVAYMARSDRRWARLAMRLVRP